MIGVIVPAHDEAELIDGCLRSISVAARHRALEGEDTDVLLVLDHCTDATAAIASRHPGVRTLAVSFRNVGRARAAGADVMLARGARWLAFTDADTRVSPGWLVEQLSTKADAVCGSVGVDDWTPYGPAAAQLRERFHSSYHDANGHSHIHGANLGVSAQAYTSCGGFPPLACSEDVALVRALQACGANIAWSAAPRVSTSARRRARVTGGFSGALGRLLATAESSLAHPPPCAGGGNADCHSQQAIAAAHELELDVGVSRHLQEGPTMQTQHENESADSNAESRQNLVLDESRLEAAKRSLDKGAVVPSYGPWRDDVVKLLNDALATEIVCTLRYKRHHFTARGIASPKIAEEFMVHAQEETAHGDRIAERIVQLGGEPDFAPQTLLERSHADYDDATDLQAMIRANLVAERVAIEAYTQMIELIGDKDPTTRRLLVDVLSEEQEHADELSDWLNTPSGPIDPGNR